MSRLSVLLPDWRVMVECGVDTADGVKVPDVAAMPKERAQGYNRRLYSFPEAPELCIEVASPGNTPEELAEKRKLYFAAGCRECWIGSEPGETAFYRATDQSIAVSELCPRFPSQVEL
ncbi:MAG TPA: Uma2 family endonuclease [Opitutaceae bacterium]